ncbi:protein aubergine-like [Anopheles nili]|uniref:protein aubergine-like n=1 Tax=Anopheles nili TaxID=185578 RepID=UPI00237C135D|nr:protein aubergine-like [Anopheles nili]
MDQPKRGGGRGMRPQGGAGSSQPNWKKPGTGEQSAPEKKPDAADMAEAGPSSAKAAPVQRGGGNGGGDAPGRGAMRGTRFIPDLVVTRVPNAPTKQGVSGDKVVAKTNYFRLTRKEDSAVFQYRIDFEPLVEDQRVMHTLLRTQGPLFGPYIFEGTMLFLYNKLRNDEVELQVKDPRTELLYKLKIRHVGTVDMTSDKAFMILNLMHRQAMGSLKLLLINRNFYDPQAKVSVPQYGLELYPGYVTSIRQHERDIMLCVEITHRVMRTDTCYKVLQSMQRHPPSFRANFSSAMIGAQVMSTYNQKTYKICDVDFNTTPSSSFSTKQGDSITFVKYYKDAYNITIRDPRQPMLVSMPNMRQKRAGITSPILLVPELCRLTGITEEMRRDFNLMRSIADHTRIGADKRIERLQRFNERLQQTPASREVFEFWKTELDRRLVEVPARTLKQERIMFNPNDEGVPAGPDAEWTQAFRNQSMFKTVPLQRWYVICESGKETLVKDFLGCLVQAGRGMRFQISQPQICTLPNDATTSYVDALTSIVNKDPQMIMCIVPNDRAERYSAIKKKCCIDRAIPCQVIKARTITPKNGAVRTLMTIATKVVIQLNCKLGGIPWMVKNPLTSVMVVGYDVCHESRDKSKSYGALVATMYAPKYFEPRYFSVIERHERGEELSNFMSSNIVKALRSYQREFGANMLPRRILFYRDGVGEGQLRHVVEHEVRAIKESLMKVYANHAEYKAQLTVVVVNKRINTRLFVNGKNPPPGTIVDDTITLPERTDFFLISQTVRQGTVSPTAYNVVYDESGLNADQLQVYTSKQTHLYYNWCGSVAVPAVCQYAHKLAFLTSQFLHQQPHAMLEKRLYYL